MMDARLKEGLTRSESMNAFEKLKDDVQQWLKRMEGRIDALQPVAVDQKLLKDQGDELKVRNNTDAAGSCKIYPEVKNVIKRTVSGCVFYPDRPQWKRPPILTLFCRPASLWFESTRSTPPPSTRLTTWAASTTSCCAATAGRRRRGGARRSPR